MLFIICLSRCSLLTRYMRPSVQFITPSVGRSVWRFVSPVLSGLMTFDLYHPKIAHSLTHCCAWPAEGRSVLHIERSWPAIHAAPTDRPVSSSNCCSQFLRGRPGGRFQSAAGGVPVWASIDSCSACEAGVFSGRRQMWPNNEWRLSHWLLRWIPCHTIWYQGYDAVPACEKTGSCHWSTLRIVHVSEPYNTTDCTRELGAMWGVAPKYVVSLPIPVNPLEAVVQ